MKLSAIIRVGAGTAALAAMSAVATVAWQSAGMAGEAGGGSVTVLGEPVPPERIEAGRHLYAENCASCHGVDLEGQPDWQRRLDNGRMPAPPHDASGHTWHHSDRALILTTNSGLGAVVPGYDSDMPAFWETLTDVEIADVLAFIKSTWPERQRAYQAEITANDEGKP